MTVFEKPSRQRRAALRAMAMAGNDNDLDPLDRRTRDPAIVNGVRLTVGDDVLVGNTPVTVLCPGRGRDWFCATWLEDGHECYGTFFVSDIAP